MLHKPMNWMDIHDLLCTNSLQVDLSGPVGGVDVAGTVTSLGHLPLQSSCSAEFEVEGIDYYEPDATLRVIVMSPGACIGIDSKTYRFQG